MLPPTKFEIIEQADVHERGKVGQDKGIETMLTGGQEEAAYRQVTSRNLKANYNMEENEKQFETAGYFVNKTRGATSDGGQQRPNSLIDERKNGPDKYEYEKPQKNYTQNNPGQFLEDEQEENDNKGNRALFNNQSVSNQAEETQSSPCCSENSGENGNEEDKMGKEHVDCDSTPCCKQTGGTQHETMPSKDIPGNGKTFQRVSVIVPTPFPRQTEETIVSLENSNTSKNGGEAL